MSLQGIILTVGVGITVIATVWFSILNQNRHQAITANENSTNARPRQFKGQKTCGVCLENENWDKTILKCGHWLHGKCLQALKRNSDCYNRAKCPFCRAPI